MVFNIASCEQSHAEGAIHSQFIVKNEPSVGNVQKGSLLNKKRKRRKIGHQAKPFEVDTLLSRQDWRILGTLIAIAAAVPRLVYLAQKPLHHDEGVNGFFMVNLFRNGIYRYDPTNYHGPSLYYCALITTTLNSFFFGREGLSTFAVRLVPAIFGTATVWLVLQLHSKIGKLGAATAALLICVSPGNVFFSRYFVHEVLFVFFTLALVASALRYHDTRQPRFLILASASAALLFATKETSLITFAVLLVACLGTRGLSHDVQSATRVEEGVPKPKNPELSIASRLAVYVFLIVSVTLYSSFFSNFPQGVYDSVRTYSYWVKAGLTQYSSPWFTYLTWLSKEELPILMCGAFGIVIAFVQRNNRFALFSAYWALGTALAYSLISYKTPWLTLNIILPLAIMSGYGLQELYSRAANHNLRALKFSVIIAMLGSMTWSAYQAIELSFFRYDDDHIPYSYAHTSRDFLGLVSDIESVATANGLGKGMGIVVVSSEHWPLYWYLRDYPRAAFLEKVGPTDEPVIIALDTQAAEIEEKLGKSYRRLSSHELRPGNTLVLFLRRDLHARDST